MSDGLSIGARAGALSAFRQADASKTGQLNAQQLSQAQAFLPAPLREAVKTEGAAKVIASFDADKNGSLSSAEFVEGVASLSQDQAAILLAAQEAQPLDVQYALQQQSSAFASLNDTNTAGSLGSTAYAVLAAYATIGR